MGSKRRGSASDQETVPVRDNYITRKGESEDAHARKELDEH
jgi:hypothetical protein